MEISAQVFLQGCILDGAAHGDIVFNNSAGGLNNGVLSSFTKKAKDLRTYYLCFDGKKTPKKHVMRTLSMVLGQFNMSFYGGHTYYFSLDFIGSNEKVNVYAYGNNDTVFHFFIAYNSDQISVIEYLSKNHSKVVFELI